MKKRTFKLLLLIMVLAASFSLTACGRKIGKWEINITRVEGPDEKKREDREESKDEDKSTDEYKTGAEEESTGGNKASAEYNSTDENKTGTEYNSTGENKTGTEYNSTGENKTGDTDKSITGNTESSGLYDTVEDYVNSSEVQNVLNAFESQLSGSGMSIKITAEGNTMLYTFTYENLQKQEGMAESLEAAMETQNATFQTTVNQLKAIVKTENPVIVIEYVDSNGVLIYSKVYTAN